MSRVLDSDTDSWSRSSLKTVLIFACMFFVYLWGLGDSGLCDPDEGRYAEIPRAMLATGDYVTPRLNGLKYFEKPVLTYWISAASLKLFGENNFAVRFPAAATALIGVMFLWLLVKREYGRDVADLASVVLGGSLLYFSIGRIILTDMPLSACLTMTFVSTWFAIRGERRRFWLSLAFAGMGLSVLAKGLIGLVLPGGVIIMYAILLRNPGVIWLFASYLPGYAIFAAVTVPWFWMVCSRNPDFFYFFFIHEHFMRYATTIHGRYEPVWFFIPIIIVGFLPWIAFLPLAFKDAIKAAKGAMRDKCSLSFELYLLCWFAFILAFFSASGSKLIPYIVPAMPPVAAMIAHGFIKRIGTKSLNIPLVINSLLLLFFAVAFWSLPHFFDDSSYDLKYAYSVGRVIALSMLLMLISFLSYLSFFNNRGTTSKRLRALLPIFIMIFVLAVAPIQSVVASKKSVSDLCVALKDKLKPEDVIINYDDFIQGLQFGLNRRILIVDYVGELEFGKNAEPEVSSGWFMTRDEFAKYIDTKTSGEKVLVLEIRDIEKIPQEYLRGSVLILATHNFAALRLR